MTYQKTRTIFILAFIALTFFATACKKAPGTLELSVYGEDYIEQGIPADNFDDGWAVKFKKFDVGLSNISLVPIETKDRSPKDIVSLTSNLSSPSPLTFNLAQPSNDKGQLALTAPVPPGRYTITFALGPIHIEGSAEKNGSIKTFDWNIDEVTGYEKCELPIEIKSGQKTPFQITVHADHLFFNSISSESPKVLFHPYAYSDENEDGKITTAELNENKELFGLDAGKFPVTSMVDFLNLQARTVGHVNGETHCKKIVNVK